MPQMVTAEELRDRIDKFAQKAEELLIQGDLDNARAHQEQVKILQKRLDEVTGGDVLQLDEPCYLGMLLAPQCLGMLLAPLPGARGLWLWSRAGCGMILHGE